jgi:hypothetical protein
LIENDTGYWMLDGDRWRFFEFVVICEISGLKTD